MLPGLYEIREMAPMNKKHFIFNMVRIKSHFFHTPRCISVTCAPHIVFSLDFNFYKDSSHHMMSIKAHGKERKKKWTKVSTSLEWTLLREFLTIYHLPTQTFAGLVDVDTLNQIEALDRFHS